MHCVWFVSVRKAIIHLRKFREITKTLIFFTVVKDSKIRIYHKYWRNCAQFVLLCNSSAQAFSFLCLFVILFHCLSVSLFLSACVFIFPICLYICFCLSYLFPTLRPPARLKIWFFFHYLQLFHSEKYFDDFHTTVIWTQHLPLLYYVSRSRTYYVTKYKSFSLNTNARILFKKFQTNAL